MNGLALATWRLPQTQVEDLEAAHRHVGDLGPDVFELTTCQRVILCTQAGPGDEALERARALAEGVDVPGGERLAGFEAFRHLVTVAASLDALLPGEDQVPAQVRRAVDEQAEAIDPGLHRILQRVLATARSVRDEAGLAGHRSAPLAELAVERIPDEGPVAVWGTGTFAEATLAALPEREVHVVSRDPDRAAELAGDPARAWSRDAILAGPPRLDGLVCCTRSPDGRVLSRADVEALLVARRQPEGSPSPRPLKIVDLGVPRNVDPAVDGTSGLMLESMATLARLSRGRARADERIRAARDALEDALARERRRHWKAHSADRITALREDLSDEIQELVAELAGASSELEDDALERWTGRVHGRVAHTAQEHLLSAMRGEDP